MLTINNTIDGYLKDIEIKGNTIQDINQTGDLADIRSVGDKLENQELYKIPVLSANKNLFSYDFYDYSSYSQLDNTYVLKEIKLPVGIITISNKKIKEQTSDMGNLIMQFWDNTTYNTSTRTSMINSGWGVSSKNTITIEEGKKYYVAISIKGNTLSKETTLEKVKDIYEIQIEVGDTATPYEEPKQHKLTILSPKTLKSYNGTKDRIVCKNGVWVHEENVTYDEEGNGTILSKSIDTPLPHDQQISIRTFANKTNIHFECEIEPTLKASVPKSLGASVSSNTEQIDILHRELDKIKKLLLQSEVVF